MKSVTYVGQPVHLGRFGDVKPGDVLIMRETEWQSSLRNSPQDFELNTGKPVDPSNLQPQVVAGDEGGEGETVEVQRVEGDGQPEGEAGGSGNEESPETVKQILPVKTEHYDLSKVDWNNGKVLNFLESQSRATLDHIIDAIQSLGGEIESAARAPRKEKAATIHAFVGAHGWTV